MTAAVGMTTREHEQQTAGAVAEEETAAAVTAVKESGSTAAPGQLFLDDVYNMVNDYTADGFDALEDFVKTQLPADEATRAALQKGVQGLYERVKATLEANLSEFETAAKQRCFSQPVAPTAEAPENAEAQASGSDAYSEEEEAAVDRELTELRTAIALGRAHCKQMKNDISLLGRQVEQYGDSSQLERVLQEVRPQDVGEEAVALAEYGAKLKPLLAWAEHLREGKRVQTDFHSANATVTATKAINRRKLEVSGASIDDLRQLREKFGLAP